MSRLRHRLVARRGQALLKLLTIVVSLAALVAVIKSFAFAAECYASAAETIRAIGEDH